MRLKIAGMCLLSATVLTGVVSALEMEMVFVGDAGNIGDSTGFGGVDYEYYIGKYEVTNAQYCEFLNAVAASDPYQLYDSEMGGGWNDIGGIARSGSNGSYTYTVRAERGNRPVLYVSWDDALRFANWMHNGQPTGAQDDTTTEDGAYDMSLGENVVRATEACFFLPTEDEWYKAAYYKGGDTHAGYWGFPTQSDTAPTPEPPPGTDAVNGSANYYKGGNEPGGYIDITYYTTTVGAYSSSASAYGTFDQAGNVWEWNEETMIDPGVPYPLRVIRGGSFLYGTDEIHLHASYRGGNTWGRGGRSVGFRIASVVPEPGTLALLLSVMTMILAWRRR